MFPAYLDGAVIICVGSREWGSVFRGMDYSCYEVVQPPVRGFPPARESTACAGMTDGGVVMVVWKRPAYPVINSVQYW